MSVRDLAFALALGIVLAGAASAQEAASPTAGRAWTDPPDRKAASSPAAGREEAKPQDARTADAPVPAAGSRQSARSQRTASAAARSPTAKRHAESRAAPRRLVRRDQPAERQARRSPAVRTAAVRPAPERHWTVRTYRPAYAEAPGFRYGYTSEDLPAYRGRNEGFRDIRAARLREAREAGYLVVRAGDLNALRSRPFELRRDPEDETDPEE